MAPDLTTFARNLSWTPALVDCCQAWLDACGDLLDRRFRASCERDAKLAWLLTAYLGLPEGLRKDFLLSPRVTNQLIVQDADHVPAFAEIAPDLVRVLARSRAGAAADSDLAEMLAAFGRDDSEVRGISLDFDSTIHFPFQGPDGGDLRVLQPDRAAQTRQRLEAALDALEQARPIVLNCLRLLTRRLAVREEEGRVGNAASCVFGHLTLLTNPWAERADTAWLLDSLVHESIHAALFFYDAIQGPLFLPGNCSERIPSPWSGNSLTCAQYVQACFVWFGLAQLWRNWPAGVGGVSCESASQMYRRASQGFLARPVQSLLSHTGGRLVPPPVREALLLLEQCALDA
jgi:hypothetical protein